MTGRAADGDLPHLVRHTAAIWQQFVERELRHAPFHRELPIWILALFRDISSHMSFQTWKEGGCEVLADLYPNETF